ncbi:MAG: hypothetical protein ACRDRN_10355 [Sciscionella sp.]
MTEQPTAPATPGSAPAPAPVPAPPPPTAEPDWKAIAEKAQADIESWKGHAREWETRARGNQQAEQAAAERDAKFAKIAEALGLPQEKPDPEKIASELATSRTQAAQLARENAVLLAAAQSGADAGALLDSRSFAAQIAGIDPTDRAGIEAAIKAAVDANPRYATAAPQAPAPVPPRQASTAGSFNASPGGARQLGAADVARMSGAELSKASKQGLLAEYFASPNQ